MTMYASVARAKQHQTLYRADTTLLTNLLEAASDLVDNYCDQSFTSASATEYYDGNGLKWIIVDRAPITAITSLTITDDNDTDHTIATTDLSYDGSTGKVQFKPTVSSAYDYFLPGFQNVTIVYTAGYTTIPEAIQEATVQIARNLYAQGSTYKNPAFSAARMGEHNYTRISSQEEIMTPIVTTLLAKYRRIPL